MTDRFVLLAHWSVRQKLNRVSSVQLFHSVRTLINIINSSASNNLYRHFTLATKKLTIRHYTKQSMPYIPLHYVIRPFDIFQL